MVQQLQVHSLAGAPITADDKAVATLISRAALAGFELVRLADGSFIASRWGMFRNLDHVAAVEAFLRRVEAPRS